MTHASLFRQQSVPCAVAPATSCLFLFVCLFVCFCEDTYSGHKTLVVIVRSFVDRQTETNRRNRQRERMGKKCVDTWQTSQISKEINAQWSEIEKWALRQVTQVSHLAWTLEQNLPYSVSSLYERRDTNRLFCDLGCLVWNYKHLNNKRTHDDRSDKVRLEPETAKVWGRCVSKWDILSHLLWLWQLFWFAVTWTEAKDLVGKRNVSWLVTLD